jgi:esterase/lipase superfamily enzyme
MGFSSRAFAARTSTVALLALPVLLVACAARPQLMPTPRIYVGEAAPPLFTGGTPATTAIDLLYVTDRVPITKPDGSLGYTSDRSHSMAFGSVTVDIGEKVAWPTLAAQSIKSSRELPLDLHLAKTTELGRFPTIPYMVDSVAGEITRSAAVVDAHEQASASLQAEVARRIAASPRRDVVLFVHGYANTFEEAAFDMADLCHFLGREFVCGIFSWPAGGTRGFLAGYNVDRESGEFAVQHLKQTIRLIAQTSGVERIHLMAHSRGTDVLSSALRELNIEAYMTGGTLSGRFKLKNVVLLAPDIDGDVAAAKIFGVVSDPDLPFGAAPQPRKVLPSPGFRITAYVSAGDKALTLSQLLFGSLIRLGRADVEALPKEKLEKGASLAYVVDFVEVKATGGVLGHSYYNSNPKVSADLIALIRYGLRPGDPGRPLEEIQRPFWRIPADS